MNRMFSSNVSYNNTEALWLKIAVNAATQAIFPTYVRVWSEEYV